MRVPAPLKRKRRGKFHGRLTHSGRSYVVRLIAIGER
jgi:hypothetical protein